MMQIGLDQYLELLGKFLEYEHAIDHVADIPTHTKSDLPFCKDCANVAQSAIDGVNRQDFLEIADDYIGLYDKLVGEDRVCQCGHKYGTHFDWIRQGGAPIGCRANECDCARFSWVDESGEFSVCDEHIWWPEIHGTFVQYRTCGQCGYMQKV